MKNEKHNKKRYVPHNEPNERAVKECEKAVEVLKTKYGIDARIYGENVYLSVWNDDLSDTIDVEASKGQVEDWAFEHDKERTWYGEYKAKQ